MNPPSLPTWLLQRFGANEALLGDLLEQYHSGRSTVWYWRQVLLAIVVSVYREILEHKLLAVRAVITGWFALWGLGAALERTHITMWVQDGIVGSGFASFARWWVDYSLGFNVFASVVFAASGWLVSRLSGTHWAAMLFAFLASIPVLSFPVYVERIRHLVVDGLDTQSLVINMFVFLVLPLCVLLGGLLGARPLRGSPRQAVASHQ